MFVIVTVTWVGPLWLCRVCFERGDFPQGRERMRCFWKCLPLFRHRQDARTPPTCPGQKNLFHHASVRLANNLETHHQYSSPILDEDGGDDERRWRRWLADELTPRWRRRAA